MIKWHFKANLLFNQCHDTSRKLNKLIIENAIGKQTLLLRRDNGTYLLAVQKILFSIYVLSKRWFEHRGQSILSQDPIIVPLLGCGPCTLVWSSFSHSFRLHLANDKLLAFS